MSRSRGEGKKKKQRTHRSINRVVINNLLHRKKDMQLYHRNRICIKDICICGLENTFNLPFLLL